MKLKSSLACVALMVAIATPAWALQLGQIQVKSALNQPLVAAIPLHPKDLAELDGLTVGLAPAEDFARAGLQITPTDQTLQFHVVTDNNGQKLILVTSSQPVTDPYLDFLVQVNTRRGKQVGEFVVLLNPVIAAQAPAVQAAPVPAAPVAPTANPPSAQLPPASAFPQPVAEPTKPAAQPMAPPPPRPAPTPVAQRPAPAAAATPAAGDITVSRGDTLYGIAKEQTEGTRANINQLMVALKAANPDAFFKDNINSLKAGAILRIPTRDVIDQTSIAEANAEVHRQYEAWRAARPHAATLLQGTATEAAANAAPKPGKAGPAADHLALTPPTGDAGGTSNRAGVAGGTGKEAVAGLQQKMQNDHSALVSLNQANADLDARVRSLEDIAAKSDKLLSLKDATIAELQRKLAAIQAGKPAVAAAPAVAAKPATTSAAPQSAAAGKVSATQPPAPWYMHPLAWIIAGLVALGLIVIGLLRGRRDRRAGSPAIANGPLPDPEDIAAPQPDIPGEEAALRDELERNPDDLAAHLGLCRLHYMHGDAPRFLVAARAMRSHVADPASIEWREVAVMGEDLAPQEALFATAPLAVPDDAPDEQAPREDNKADAIVASAPVPVSQAPAYVSAEEDADATLNAEHDGEPPANDTHFAYSDDPVDTKLDLARAYLDMGDPVGARAMLEEVMDEGSQAQQDQARRLLADVAG